MNLAFLALALFAQAATAQPAPEAAAKPAAGTTATAADQPAKPAATDATVRIRPTPEVISAFQAWGSCLDAGVKAVSKDETPEAAAPKVVTGCATQLASFNTISESWISGLAVPAAVQTQLRTKLAGESTGVEQRVMARIRELRAPPRPAVVGR